MRNRLLRSFYYMNESNLGIAGEIALSLNELKGYFYKFNKDETDEAMARAYIHALKNYDGYSEFKPYLKNLARTIMRTVEKEVYVDDFESMAVDEKTSVERSALEGIVFDDTNDLIVKQLMLPFIDEFLYLGGLMESNEFAQKTKTDFSERFRYVCKTILSKIKGEEFMKSILYLYNKNSDELRWFLEQDNFIVKTCREAEYSTTSVTNSEFKINGEAKRYSIVNENGEIVKQPDTYKGKMFIKGVLGNKKVYKVNYIDLLNDMIMMARSYITNELTIVNGKYKIVRTCSGSYSQVNPDMENVDNLMLDELITSIVYCSKCKLLSVGYEYIYLLEGKYFSGTDIEIRGMIGFGDVTLKAEIMDIEEYKC